MGRVEGAIQDHATNVFQSSRVSSVNGLVWSDRGVIHQNVDASEGGHCRVNHGVDLVLLGDVSKNGQSLDTQFLHGRRGRFRFIAVAASVDYNIGSFRSHHQRGGPADVPA